MEDKDDIQVLIEIQKDIENNNLNPAILDVVMKVVKSSQLNDEQTIAYTTAMVGSLLTLLTEKSLLDENDLSRFVELYTNYTQEENGDQD